MEAGCQPAMQAADFDRLVAAACERIPARFRKRLKNVAMIVEAEPHAGQLARGRVPRGGTLLGLYEGRPLTVHGDGSQTRSFQYVDDLVEGLIHVGLDRRTDGEVFNIGNPHEITVRELAQRIIALVDPRLPIVEIPSRPGDPQRRKPDITRMKATFGWRPQVALDEGLRRTIDAFQMPSPRVAAEHAAEHALEHVESLSPTTAAHAVPVGWAIPAVQEPAS